MALPSDNLPSDDSPISDEFLIRSMLGGDSGAFRTLMNRYDRLVRYSIFQLSQSQCKLDPDWLDTIAADAWTGFVQSLQREGSTIPTSVPAYLARVAKFRCISAQRRIGNSSNELPLDDSFDAVDSDDTSPLETIVREEQIGALKECIAALSDQDRRLAEQLDAIMKRKWRIVSEALDVPESTARSRWKQVLGRLSACVTEKTGKDLAHEDQESD